MLQGGDSGTKRVKSEQKLEPGAPNEVETGEKGLRVREQQMDSNTSENVGSTSDVDGRPDKFGDDELPKGMQEMKIRDDKTDINEENIKVH